MLTLLPLSHSSFSKEAVALAIETMKTNRSVESLSMPDCHIDDASALALAAVLRENSTLTKLDLSDNAIKFGEACADGVANGLKDLSLIHI